MGRLFDDAVPARAHFAEVAVVSGPGTIVGLNEELTRSFCADLIQRSAAISDKVIAEGGSAGDGEFAKKLGEVALVAKGMDPASMVKASGIVGWVRGAIGNSKERLLASFKTMEQQIDALTADLRRHADLHKTRGALLQQLFDENADLYRGLQDGIRRGREILAAERGLIAGLPAPRDPLEAQLQARRTAEADRFEKHLSDLDIAMTLSLQTGVEIQMMQDTGRALVEKFDMLIGISIPSFKKSFSLYRLQSEQKQSLHVAKTIDDATNDAIRRNAEMVHQNAVEIATVSQRNIVDLDTVKFAHAQIIGAVEDSQRIYSEAVTRRRDETAQLSKLRQEFVTQISQSNKG